MFRFLDFLVCVVVVAKVFVAVVAFVVVAVVYRHFIQ